MHGIFFKKDKSGVIIISARIEDNLVRIKVSDDGVGMPEERINVILKEDSNDYRSGYGAKNTNDRIKLYYGQDYGLIYSSKSDCGTTVDITFPARKHEYE